MAKYIDAKKLKAEIEKRLKNTRDYMNGTGMKYKGPKYYKAQGKESAYDAILNVIDSLQQEQPDEHYTKRNELFDKCVENCDPEVMKEVSDNVDKLRAISTPVEEDWFKIAEDWEKEDNK